MTDDLAVSVDRAAEMLGLKRDLMFKLVLGGDISSFKVGSRRLISVEALREYVERRTAEPAQVEA